MKIIISTLLFMILAQAACAQEYPNFLNNKKGNDLISFTLGTTGFSHFKSDFLGFRWGYFPINRLVFGTEYNLYRNVFLRELTVGVFSRYYLREGNFSPYVELSYSCGFINQIAELDFYENRLRSGVLFTPGLSYSITPKFAMESFAGLHIGRDLEFPVLPDDREPTGNMVFGLRLTYQFK